MQHSTYMALRTRWVEQWRQFTKISSTAFTTHPREAGETYLQHLWFTAGMSYRFVLVSIVLFLHGLLPFIFIRTASNRIEKIYSIMKARASKAINPSPGEYDI